MLLEGPEADAAVVEPAGGVGLFDFLPKERKKLLNPPPEGLVTAAAVWLLTEAMALP